VIGFFSFFVNVVCFLIRFVRFCGIFLFSFAGSINWSGVKERRYIIPWQVVFNSCGHV